MRDRTTPLPPLARHAHSDRPARYHRFEPPVPSRLAVLLRLLAWTWTWISYRTLTGLDVLTRQDSHARRARRLRHHIERAGGAAALVGRQLAMRLDLLPVDFAAELALLECAPRPLSLDFALARVEAAAGRPLSEVYARIDPEPVLVDGLSAVYQAELPTGVRVAIRVRRPEIAGLIAVELAALSWLIAAARVVQPSDTDVLEELTHELRPLLFDGLDYVRVARLQRLFRKRARRMRMRHVSAARIHHGLSSSDVLVSEFVEGVFLSEVIDGCQAGDAAAQALFRERGVDPTQLGRDLLHGSWWGMFENVFFVGIPSADDLVVRQGRFVYVGMSNVGRISFSRRRHLLEAMACFADHDMEGAVANLLSLLTPLPRIDVHEMTRFLESRMWVRAFAMNDRRAPWWTRTSTGLWLVLLETAQEYGVSVSLDVSRALQSLCLHDHLAGQLWPGLRLFREFRRYQRRSAVRKAREHIRRQEARARRTSGGGPLAALRQLEPAVRRLTFALESTVENVPAQYVALSRKGAYTTAQTLWALSVLAQITGAVLLVQLGADALRGQQRPVTPLLLEIILHPVWLLTLLLILSLAARRILMRLADVDPDAS